MSITAAILPEFDHEMATTRSLLERVPAADASWKPHPRSSSLGELAMHLATIPALGLRILDGTELDLNPPGGPAYTIPELVSTAALLETFDAMVRDVRAALAAASDQDLMVVWTFKNGGETIFALPRVAVLRTMLMNHIIHHRGQLSVYLRLLDVPLPSIYGPTADTEMEDVKEVTQKRLQHT